MFFILRDRFSLSICEILIFTYINHMFHAGPVISFTRAQIQFGSFLGNWFVVNAYSSTKEFREKKGTWLEFSASEHYARCLHATYTALKEFSSNKVRLLRYFYLDVRTIFIYLLVVKYECLEAPM